MDDYVFLEDLSRRVSEWGQDIARSGYGTLQARRGRGDMRPGKTRKGMSRNKRDILKSQLELREIEMDLLPSGMERRTLNQSTWDSKYTPNDAQEPYTILTHRNNFDLPLRDLFQSQIIERTKRKTVDMPTWVKTLALPHPDIPDVFTPPQFFIRAPLNSLSGQHEKFGYIMLDSERKFSTLLRNKHFVEFPTIEVWEEGAFRGVLFDGVRTFRTQGGQRPTKRQRLDVTKGRAAISGLLGGYGSEDDDEADTALTRLGEYEGSDAENVQPTTSEEGNTDTDGLAEDDDDDEGEPGAMVDPATLLAMVQEAQRRHGEDGEDEEVDYGESDGDS
ncbi:hypothetical protein BJV77DRAFT_1063968 [Russula vinacea]|nr:hypothetical protein BJV77DRAFT_1063968 [Russula vinacea]